MSRFIDKLFQTKNKINSESNNAKNNKKPNPKPKTDINTNLKGQRIDYDFDAVNVSHGFDINSKERAPQMLTMRTRIKVWGALFGIGLYFYLCYKLIRYRLKADDLDLMEREVNEEYKLKLKLKEIGK